MLWNVDEIRDFLVKFSQLTNSNDNNLIYNLKLFVRQITTTDISKFNDPDNPIDFDVLNLRDSLDQIFKESKQFQFNEKGDAIEAYEWIVYQIYMNLLDSDEELAEEFSDLVDVNAKISDSYVHVEEMLSPIQFSKQTAAEDIAQAKFNLIMYLKNFFELQESKEKADKHQLEDDKNEDTESYTGIIFSSFLEPTCPKLFIVNLAWGNKNTENIFKLLRYALSYF